MKHEVGPSCELTSRDKTMYRMYPTLPLNRVEGVTDLTEQLPVTAITVSCLDLTFHFKAKLTNVVKMLQVNCTSTQMWWHGKRVQFNSSSDIPSPLFCVSPMVFRRCIHSITRGSSVIDGWFGSWLISVWMKFKETFTIGKWTFSAETQMYLACLGPAHEKEREREGGSSSSPHLLFHCYFFKR